MPQSDRALVMQNRFLAPYSPPFSVAFMSQKNCNHSELFSLFFTSGLMTGFVVFIGGTLIAGWLRGPDKLDGVPLGVEVAAFSIWSVACLAWVANSVIAHRERIQKNPPTKRELVSIIIWIGVGITVVGGVAVVLVVLVFNHLTEWLTT